MAIRCAELNIPSLIGVGEKNYNKILEYKNLNINCPEKENKLHKLMKEFILINQRLDKFGKFKEKRDNLDARFTKFILKIGMVPLLVPNDKKFIKYFLNSGVRIKGIILSPGGDPRTRDDRSYVENKLIKHAIIKKLPLLGLCRGAQKLNLYFNGKIKSTWARKKKSQYLWKNCKKQKNKSKFIS